jgi:hypothetical protein
MRMSVPPRAERDGQVPSAFAANRRQEEGRLKRGEREKTKERKKGGRVNGDSRRAARFGRRGTARLCVLRAAQNLPCGGFGAKLKTSFVGNNTYTTL